MTGLLVPSKKNELDLPQMLRILDSCGEFEKKWHAEISRYAITGGDPLLYPDWKPFLAEVKRRGKRISMMGNPETLTEENLSALAGFGVSHYQLSLDGLKQTHDSIRGPGRFAAALQGLEKLKNMA